MIQRLRLVGIWFYLVIATLPLVWIALTSIKDERHVTATNLNVVPSIGTSLYAGIDFVVPPQVQENAKIGLEAWGHIPEEEDYKRGLMAEFMEPAARLLARGEPPHHKTLREMQAWFGVHKPIKEDSRSWKTRDKKYQDWMGLGGEAAVVWVDRMVEKMRASDKEWENTLAYAPSLEAYSTLAEPAVPGQDASFLGYLLNSIIIGLISTLAAVVMGTSTAYGFSRFKIAGSRDWLFFILSTRFLPPLAVIVPIWMMFGTLGLRDTHLGLAILYTAFNLSLSVWLMKGFIDEIPQAYEEAAMVDGYTRLQAFWKIVVPQARTGMAVTAVFCLISAWNEFAFAVTLNPKNVVTVPVFFAMLNIPTGPLPWHKIAAGVLIFALPIVIFTVLVRKHLLRGVTFGTIKQ